MRVAVGVAAAEGGNVHLSEDPLDCFGGRGGSKMGGKLAGRRRREKKEDVLTRVRKKTCRFCEEKVELFDYKDMRRFERLISERGKMLSRRITFLKH